MDLISVIVPVYNVEQYLKDCIDSVISQTYKNIEIILIDDGSTDYSGTICDDYQTKDNRIKVIHKENGGLSSARNCGIDTASGKFITFVDSDDIIQPKYIEYLYNALIAYDADFSWCYFNYAKKLIKDLTASDEFKPVLLVGCEFYNEEAYKKGGVNSTAKLFKREIFSKIRFSDGRIHEDAFLYNDLLKNKFERVVLIENELYIYRLHNNSIVKSKMTDKKLMDSIDVNIELLNMVEDDDEKKELLTLCLNNLCKFIFHQEWTRKNKDYLKIKIKFFCKKTLKHDKRLLKRIKYSLGCLLPSLYLIFIKRKK